MLRTIVLALGVALLIGSALSALYGDPGLTLWLLAVGGTITAGTAFERVFYKPISPEKPGRGWTDTGERFIDPESGRIVEVFFDPTSGERKYVEAGRK